MTEAELITAAQAGWSNVISLIAILISVLSGYLVVAYLAGADMTRSQNVIVTSLYLLISIFILWSMFTLVERSNEMAMLAIDMSKQRTLGPKGYVAHPIAIVFAICTVASIKFMWDVRHPKTE